MKEEDAQLGLLVYLAEEIYEVEELKGQTGYDAPPLYTMGVITELNDPYECDFWITVRFSTGAEFALPPWDLAVVDGKPPRRRQHWPVRAEVWS